LRGRAPRVFAKELSPETASFSGKTVDSEFNTLPMTQSVFFYMRIYLASMAVLASDDDQYLRSICYSGLKVWCFSLLERAIGGITTRTYLCSINAVRVREMGQV
jgi:hypothetical protein